MLYLLSDDMRIYNYLDDVVNSNETYIKKVNFFFAYMRREDWTSVYSVSVNGEDQVIVSIEDAQKCNATKAFLVDMGMAEKNIIDISLIRNAMLPANFIDRRMLKKAGKQLDGVILGISHSFIGLNVDVMSHEFVNLSQPSQDLYYNYQALKYLALNYPNEVCSIKHAIIDMFDYSYFNYDISMAAYAQEYYKNVGTFLGKHNYDKNKHFSCSLEELVEKVMPKRDYEITDREMDIWNKYFEGLNEYDCYSKTFQNMPASFAAQDEKDSFLFGKIVYEIFENTINENLLIFEDLINLLHAINPEVSIHLVLLPRSDTVEKKEKENEFILMWKDYFYARLNEFRTKYDFDIYDFKGDGEIVQGIENHYDPVHLNIFGTTKLTHYLEEQIYSFNQ